jgi:peptidoglycan/xylan/chitin deacetylase (PgdA/CDA1 family)
MLSPTMGAREQLASALFGSGALGALMRLRKLAPVPTTVTILTYHHIADEDPGYAFDPGVADAAPAQFKRQLELVARYGTPVTIAQLVRALDGEPLPKNAVMITFDDGYRSCHDVALPLLNQVGLPATFFIPTRFVSERRLYWWERIAFVLSSTRLASATIAYPELRTVTARDPMALRKMASLVKDTPHLDLDRFLTELAEAFRVDWDVAIEQRYADEIVMTWEQVRALAKAGMDVESHTKSHRVLQTLGRHELNDELSGSKRELEAQIGRPVHAIAYPVGRRVAHITAIREAVQDAGYRLGFTNGTGASRIWPRPFANALPTDPFDVRRLSTDREMSDAMYFTQIAVPRLAYIAAAH